MALFNKTRFCFSNAPDALGRAAPNIPLSGARPRASIEAVQKGTVLNLLAIKPQSSGRQAAASSVDWKWRSECPEVLRKIPALETS
jgi:hypothetical protein